MMTAYAAVNKEIHAGAIIEYLVRTYGKGKGLRPDESSSSRIAYDFWLNFAEGSALKPLLVPAYFHKYADKSSIEKMKREFSHPAFEAQSKFIESELQKSTFLAGDNFSAADIQMSFPIEIMEVAGCIGKEQPNFAAYLAKLQARPAYKKALERGGPENYQLAAFKDMM